MFAANVAQAGGIAIFNVRDYGAAGDGRQMDTAAINRTVEACAAAGGGVVYVPSGRYLTGMVVLKSHVTLHVEGGAILLGSENPADYSSDAAPKVPDGEGGGPLIYASNAENITITGRGTIDGQGAVWWQRARLKLGSGPQTPEEKAEVRKIARGRPFLIHMLRCKDVLIEHVTLRNSAFWTLSPVNCDGLRVDGITVFAEKGSINTDGINPESCRNVQILNCYIDTGDDGITLKSGEHQRWPQRPVENVTIANCVVNRAHGGVVLGAGLAGGARNIVVTNCVFQNTDIGIRIKSRRGRGALVEGLSVSNIVMENVPHPFTITMFYAGVDSPAESYPVGPGTPVYRDFNFHHIIARGAESAGTIVGRREMFIENVNFTNVRIQAKTGFSCTNAKGITFTDCFIDTGKRPGAQADRRRRGRHRAASHPYAASGRAAGRQNRARVPAGVGKECQGVQCRVEGRF